MFIATERTPNPATLKFLPGEPVMADGTVNYTSAEDAEASPLAQALFDLDGVSGVFFGDEFISVTQQGQDWASLKPQVLGVIMEHFVAKTPLFKAGHAPEPALAGGAADVATEDNPEDAPIIAQIKDLLDAKVRPAVAQDGGDIIYHGFKEGVVFLHMQGACAGCPSSTITLKNGIENLLRHYVPEVTEVRAV